MSTLVELVVYGAVQSAVLLWMALGFSLVYGVCRLPNFAHGAFWVLAGYVAWQLNRAMPYPLAALLAVAVVAALGVVVYHLILRRLRGREVAEVIATWGVGLVVLEGLRWAGLRGGTYSLPAVGGSVSPAGVPVDVHRLLVIAAVVAVVICLAWWTGHHRTGLALRAAAQDEEAAMTLGIDPDRIGLLAMALGSGLAGLGAVLVLPLGSIVVQEGYKVLISALAVAVVGGLGSWRGTVLAAGVLGYAQTATVIWLRPHYQVVVMLAAILGTLLLRPSGLLGGQKEIEERV